MRHGYISSNDFEVNNSPEKNNTLEINHIAAQVNHDKSDISM